MRILLLFILAITIALPSFGQRKKKEEETITPTFVEGIVYALPRTGIRVHVKAVKGTFTPGPYAAYAEQLLGITDAKNRASVNWKIEDVAIETFSEPDPDQVYKALGNAAYLVDLTSQGCLAGINSNVTPGSLGAVKTNSFVATPDYDDGFRFANFNDTPLYTPGDSTNNFRPVRVSPDVKAAEAAKRILDSRLTQYDMAAGLMDEFHPDGKAYQVSLDELKTIEINYLSLFVGRTTYKHETFSFDFVPTSSTAKGDVIFRFSDEKGVVPASDLSAKPVMIKVEPENSLTKKYTGLAKSDNPSAGESGIYYRMPAVADVSIIYELKTIATARTTVAQFGVVAPMPEELLYGDYSIKIHPETGAVESVVKK